MVRADLAEIDLVEHGHQLRHAVGLAERLLHLVVAAAEQARLRFHGDLELVAGFLRLVVLRKLLRVLKPQGRVAGPGLDDFAQRLQ